VEREQRGPRIGWSLAERGADMEEDDEAGAESRAGGRGAGRAEEAAHSPLQTNISRTS